MIHIPRRGVDERLDSASILLTTLHCLVSSEAPDSLAPDIPVTLTKYQEICLSHKRSSPTVMRIDFSRFTHLFEVHANILCIIMDITGHRPVNYESEFTSFRFCQ